MERIAGLLDALSQELVTEDGYVRLRDAVRDRTNDFEYAIGRGSEGQHVFFLVMNIAPQCLATVALQFAGALITDAELTEAHHGRKH